LRRGVAFADGLRGTNLTLVNVSLSTLYKVDFGVQVRRKTCRGTYANTEHPKQRVRNFAGISAARLHSQFAALAPESMPPA
jgi:hypothetical protein